MKTPDFRCSCENTITTQEALNICNLALRCAANRHSEYCNEEFFQEKYNIRTMVDALEKQIPKKPENVVRYHNICVDWNCPSCKRFHRTDNAIDYCFNCGQAIDWMDKK